MKWSIVILFCQKLLVSDIDILIVAFTRKTQASSWYKFRKYSRQAITVYRNDS